MAKTNIDYVYCNSPENIIWWLETHDKDYIVTHGFPFTAEYPLEKLKNASQIISVSYDQSQDMYLVVFRVEEE